MATPPRRFFNLSERDEPGDVVRLTQAEVEAHPAWQRFGDQAAVHPPLRGWLASAVCGAGGRKYGLLQLSDKADGADLTAEDADRLGEVAAFAGATWTLSGPSSGRRNATGQSGWPPG